MSIDGSLRHCRKQQEAKQPLIYGPYLLVVETKNHLVNKGVINLMVINARKENQDADAE